MSDDEESILRRIFQRAAVGVSAVKSLLRKTLQSLRKKAVMVIRTARSSRKDVNERIAKAAVNLGGIAEEVFRPMKGAGDFCFCLD